MRTELGRLQGGERVGIESRKIGYLEISLLIGLI